MTFAIFYDHQPQKFLEKAERDVADRIINKIDSVLTVDPVPHNATSIVGEHGVFRVRIGDFRVLYRINYVANKIIIVKIDKRPRVYD